MNLSCALGYGKYNIASLFFLWTKCQRRFPEHPIQDTFSRSLATIAVASGDLAPMTRIPTLLGAVAALVMALAPAVAEARDHHRGGYGGGYDRGYSGRGYDRGYDRGYRQGRHNDDDDALAAGIVGLALGAVIGSAITSSNNNRTNYPPRYAPPPAYYPPPPPPAYYPPQGGGYYRDYPASQPVCVLRERQWDPYAGQYVRVERRIPC